MPTVSLPDPPDRLWVHTDWGDKELIRQVPGARWNEKAGHWTVPKSWAACLQLRNLFGQRLVIDQSVHDWAFAERARVETGIALRGELDAPLTDEISARLFPHQRADRAWLEHSHDGAILANDMGLGKSVSSALVINTPALIICPNSVKGPWRDHITDWLPSATPYVLTGTNKTKVLKEAATDPSAVIIVNYELARTLSRLAPFGSVRLKRCTKCGGGDETIKATACEAHPKALNEIPFRTVIVDEAHRLKDPKSKQTRAAWSLAHGPTVEHRFALTGTPIANHPGDLWSIGHLIAPHEFPTYSAYVDRYCLLNWNSFGGMDIVGIRPDTKDELFGFLDARFRRVTKAQANLGLPPKIRSVRTVELPPKMLKAYTEVEDEMVTRLEDGSVILTPNHLTQQIRLIQFSSSFVEVNEANEIRLIDKPPSPKLDVMEEIIDELAGRQLAVCAMSRQLIDLAAARLDAKGITYGKITGTVNQSDRDWYREQFQEGKLQVMLFTLQAGGTGITLTAADTILFLQRSWSLIDNKQAEDRVHRIGSERHESINIIDVVAPNTIEVAQIARVRHKLALLEEIIRSGGDEMQFLTDNNDLAAGAL